MPSDSLFSLVKIAASSLSAKAKAVLVNVRGSVTDPDDPTAVEGSDGETLFGAIGVVARPRAADASGYAEAYAIRRDDYLTPVSGRDLRLNARMNPIDGEIGIAHYDGGFMSLRDSDDGPKKGTQVVILSPLLKDDGTIDKSHSLTMDPSAGNSSVMLMHALGHGLMLTKDKQALLASANGQNWIGVSDSGLVLNGTFNFNGAAVAGNPTTAQSVALAPPLQALLTAVVACIGDCSTVTPTHAAALSAAMTAFSSSGAATTLKASPT
jgi:hypothetical protein